MLLNLARAAVLLGALLAGAPGDATAQTTFQETIGLGSYSEGYSILASPSGGYAITGRAGANFNDDVLLVRTTSAGDTLWTRRWQFGGNEYGFGVVPAVGGGYVVGGFTNGVGAGSDDAVLIKVNEAGATQWARTYGLSHSDQLWSLQATSDGGCIAAGYTSELGAGNYDFLLFKTDASGNLSWLRTYGGEAGDQGFAVCQTSDQGFAIAGSTASFGVAAPKIFVVRTDATGGLLWAKTYGGASTEEGSGIVQTADGGFAIAGRTISFGAGGNDFLLIKTNATGDVQWARTYGGPGGESKVSMRMTPSGGFALTAATSSFGAGLLDGYFVSVDAVGSVLLSRTFGAGDQELGYSSVPMPDGGFAITGTAKSFGPLFTSLLLLKTDSTGSAGCFGATAATSTGPVSLDVVARGPVVTAPAFVTNTAPYTLFSGGFTDVQCRTIVAVPASEAPGTPLVALPNPAESSASLHFQIELATRVDLSITAADGSIVRRLVHSELPAGRHVIAWDGLDAAGRRAPRGVYFARLIHSGQSSATKIVLR
ncbi:MAG: FlgD immunoglobulin-like domain containing protein [Candidatus Eisenbacteria bacterium]